MAEHACKGIDLNSDTGERYSFQKALGEEKLFQNITSANIACGFHAGDPVQMARTVRLCREYNVQVGAHPGLPDPLGFGRRNMEISPEELEYYLLYQLGSLHHIARSLGVPVKHVKLHGALYNAVTKDEALSREVIRIVNKVDRDMILVAPFGSVMHRVALDLGSRVAVEAFADRAYDRTGALVPRKVEGSVITDPGRVVERVLGIVRGEVTTIEGLILRIQADTICLHSDTTGALSLIENIRRALANENIPVVSMDQLV
ncbi:MAG: LamB/YcsF family protein [Armatimonadetes bacterium]|nr:LamB/YcsF family protein [Armatimonadota bacterium]